MNFTYTQLKTANTQLIYQLRVNTQFNKKHLVVFGLNQPLMY